MKKILKVGFWMSVVLMCCVLISACGIETSDEPCTHCSRTPTKAYKTNVGTESYVCDKCSTYCHFCEEKATKRYTNVVEQVNFVCEDCYKEIKAMSK